MRAAPDCAAPAIRQDDVDRLARCEQPVRLFVARSAEARRAPRRALRQAGMRCRARSATWLRSASSSAPARSIVRHRAQEEDDEPNRRPSARRAAGSSALAHVVDVEIEQRRFAANDEHAGDRRGSRGGARQSAKWVVPATGASSVTRGRAPCRSRSTIESPAPSSTPLAGPDPRTPSSAAIATANSVRLNRQMVRSAWTSTRPMTAASTIAARTGCGRLRSSPEAKSTTTSVNSVATSPETGVLAPALSFTSDCDMPPLTGNAAAQPGEQVGAAEREQLLVRVEPAAVLLREHPADGRGLDGARARSRRARPARAH